MVEGPLVFPDVWLYATVFSVLVIVALIFLLRMERGKRKQLEPVEPIPIETGARWPLSVRRTVTYDVAKEAKDKLRMLDLEREILSYAIRRLYEAHGEGKISEEERDRLAEKYKEDLKRIKEEITRGETVITLNEMERMQEEFVKLFTERFEELDKRIEELRALSGLMPLEPEEPPEEEEERKAIAPPQPAEKAAPPEKKKEIGKPKAPPEKSEAEEKVERIMAEVERVLERLGQMEVEE